MRKGKKNRTIKRKKVCVYTDEAKRLMEKIRELKLTNANKSNKSKSNIKKSKTMKKK